MICQPLLVSLSRSDAVTPNAGLQAVQVEAFSSVIGFLEKLEEGLFRLGFCRFRVGEDFGGLWCDGFSKTLTIYVDLPFFLFWMVILHGHGGLLEVFVV